MYAVITFMIHIHLNVVVLKIFFAVDSTKFKK